MASIRCASCKGTHQSVYAVKVCHDLEVRISFADLDLSGTCDCGSSVFEGDHSRCWMLSAYDHDDLRAML